MFGTFFDACFHCRLFAPAPSPSSTGNHNRFLMAASVRIAVVGDIHDDWDSEEDPKALQFLQPDLVLFTGDFGNENVELVRRIADLRITKAAILGNHDSWNTHQFSITTMDAVQLQLECLGDEHIGYKRLDFPTLKLSVVGGRPFSCGGDQLFRKKLLSARYGVNDMDGSAKKIYRAATGTPDDHSIILLAHNGPKGLGSNMNDICGRDWVYQGGDHGDPDLSQAISLLKETTKYSIPLVVFGHMHNELAYGGLRKMISLGADNTIYLNGAIVPRVKRSDKICIRAFTLVEISGGKIAKIAETWVSVAGDQISLKEEHVLFTSSCEVSS
ncbi:hypothetical protein Nepgr_029143 [Nepenthes gracilis]|uniref:Calcineurin-like phosphoesterase domain-containing protein n=1 Tax=Nepenthes gracilis TaxID=150966 RepID=A0AAD3Y4L0_NEPGR|nr:hypothetical protein Nepgr_029143 [Nepenthes gracilis]